MEKRVPLTFTPYIRLAMYHTWLVDYFADRSIFDHEIIYIDKGKMKLEIGGKTYILQEGDLVYIPPRIHHRITWYSENCSQPHVHFDFLKDEKSEVIPVSMKRFEDMNEMERSYFREDFLKDYHILTVSHPHESYLARNAMLDLIEAFTFSDPYRELRMEGDLKILISMILSCSSGYEKDDESTSTLSMLTRYMSEHLRENLTLRDFEMKSNLSSWALNDLFNKAYGVSPKKYYDQLRLSYAENLIRHSFKSVKEISLLLSFKDPQTFSRWFHNLTGQYPSEYKNSKKPQ